jgi:hypothetical protein
MKLGRALSCRGKNGCATKPDTSPVRRAARGGSVVGALGRGRQFGTHVQQRAGPAVSEHAETSRAIEPPEQRETANIQRAARTARTKTERQGKTTPPRR